MAFLQDPGMAPSPKNRCALELFATQAPLGLQTKDATSRSTE
jgi:hypothetical protein